MWEEKPTVIKVIEAKEMFRLLTASGGRKEAAEGDATVVGWPGEQQSMGHLALSSTAEKLAVDSAGAAS